MGEAHHPGTPAYILTALFFSESASFLAVNAGALVALVLALAWRNIKQQIELTGLVVVCLGLAVILSVVVAPVLIVRVMAPLAPVLYSLAAPVLTFKRSTFNVLALLTALTWFTVYTVSDSVGRPPALQNLEPLTSNLQPSDGLFHGNLASYITLHYYLPNVPQVVWRQANDLSQSLTDQTKTAMQMDQVTWSAVKCTRPRWWIITASNPTTSPAERDYLTNLLTTYHGEQQAVIKQGEMVDARLWLVDTRPYCPLLSQSKGPQLAEARP
ncbi:MAG: hypothetical protein HC875_16985 [Anaerolineales bacterium]|nr:hypothetical protein [Anaerolineales bacterium]